jgi:hypothetical protein
MFQEACERARRYTCPYVGLRRKHDGTVFSTMGAFIILNSEGWAITAKHVLDEIAQAQQSIAAVAGLDDALTKLRTQKTGNTKGRKHQIRDLERKKAGFLSNHAEIWAGGAEWASAKPRATDVRLHQAADLAVFRLAPFTPTVDQAYPVLRAETFSPGISVCRIGFPWHTVNAEFANNNFDVKDGFPAPLFALEGIVSRFAIIEHPGGIKAKYVQTSTPGLRGQSGGPIFDSKGRLCGLQSSTTHLDLGFDARYQRDGEWKVERQFLNVGQAVHVDEIRAFLDSNSIAYDSV